MSRPVIATAQASPASTTPASASPASATPASATPASATPVVAPAASLRPDERQALVAYITELTAIVLDASKDYLLDSRLKPIAQSLGLRSLFELVDQGRRDSTKAIERRIIDAVTTRETLFFRDQAPFDALQYKIIPELIDRRTRARSLAGATSRSPIPIRIWSAACSSGQELYSVAILLHQMLGGAKDYSLRLIGTDISDEAVATASRGEFRALDIERGLPPAYLQRYFQPCPVGWRVRDDIRAMVSFKRFNLMQDFSSLGLFDVILCRNVAIYFDEATRRNLFRRMGRQLDPDGALMLGSMEMLPPELTEFRTERHMRVAIYKLATSQRIAPPPAGV